jgi:hypothetical protein
MGFFNRLRVLPGRGLREGLLKLSVHVVVSVRRLVLHLPPSTPFVDAWRHIAIALSAHPG